MKGVFSFVHLVKKMTFSLYVISVRTKPGIKTEQTCVFARYPTWWLSELMGAIM